MRPEAWLLAASATAFMLLDAPWLGGAMILALLALSPRLGFPDLSGCRGYMWLAATLSSSVLHVSRSEAAALGYGDERSWIPVTLVAVAASLGVAMLRAEQEIEERAGETLVRLKLPSLLRPRARLAVFAVFAAASVAAPSLMLGVLVFSALGATALIVLRRELGAVLYGYWEGQEY